MESPFELHRARRDLFGDDVASYDDGRPGYPEEIYGIVQRMTGLQAGTRVLEVGPGTGQATGRLLDLGASVTAVELNAELATRLEANHVGRELTVVVGAFEDVDLPDDSFDLIASATAFHWVPPEVAVPRCAELLDVGGWIALWWTVFGDDRRPDPFHERLRPILARLAPELLDIPGAANAGAHPYALDLVSRVGEIDATGRFGPVHHEVVSWAGRHTAAEIRRLFASFSPWLALDRPRRESVLDALETLALEDFDDRVDRPYVTAVYLAPLL